MEFTVAPYSHTKPCPVFHLKIDYLVALKKFGLVKQHLVRKNQDLLVCVSCPRIKRLWPEPYITNKNDFRCALQHEIKIKLPVPGPRENSG